jgi:hypothetical protein
MFYSEYSGVVPDIQIMAKGIAGKSVVLGFSFSLSRSQLCAVARVLPGRPTESHIYALVVPARRTQTVDENKPSNKNVLKSHSLSFFFSFFCLTPQTQAVSRSPPSWPRTIS